MAVCRENMERNLKSNIHINVLIYTWWYIYSLVYFEMLKRSQTITVDLYCQELNRLREDQATYSF